jgi:hypothetical protein
MKCTVCGAEMRATSSDLPFKATDRTIVILKSLPVPQCENCAHYLIEDAVLARVDKILASSNGPAELQIIAYVAESPAHEGVPALPRGRAGETCLSARATVQHDFCLGGKGT